ncbi:MAG: hypothetical protein EOP09_20870 [Proteobacteria bacterium]|nr:MAG: hypothetical protein EOP09_20870 [Pseudomonadota bacterium]
MKKIAMSFVLIALAACSPAKESDAVDSNGMCKAALADSYNGTLLAIRSLKKYSSTEEFRNADASCNAFKTMMTGQSCQARDESGATLNVNEDSLNEACSLVKTALQSREQAEKIQNEKSKENEDQNSVKKTPVKRSK